MITSQAQIRLAQNPSCISAPDGKPKLHICARWTLQMLQLQKEKQQTTLPDKPDQLKNKNRIY
jgi:hypothetical protein